MDVHLAPAGPREPSAEPIVPGEAELARAMGLVTARLKERFASVPPPVVDALVADLLAEFDESPIRSFVPLLVERLARDRLAARTVT